MTATGFLWRSLTLRGNKKQALPVKTDKVDIRCLFGKFSKKTMSILTFQIQNVFNFFKGIRGVANPEADQHDVRLSGKVDEEANIDDIRMSLINTNPLVRRAAKNETNPKPKGAKSSASCLIMYIPIYIVSLAVLLKD